MVFNEICIKEGSYCCEVIENWLSFFWWSKEWSSFKHFFYRKRNRAAKGLRCFIYGKVSLNWKIIHHPQGCVDTFGLQQDWAAHTYIYGSSIPFTAWSGLGSLTTNFREDLIIEKIFSRDSIEFAQWPFMPHIWNIFRKNAIVAIYTLTICLLFLFLTALATFTVNLFYTCFSYLLIYKKPIIMQSQPGHLSIPPTFLVLF